MTDKIKTPAELLDYLNTAKVIPVTTTTTNITHRLFGLSGTLRDAGSRNNKLVENKIAKTMGEERSIR
jgi:hypothetical protein